MSRLAPVDERRSALEAAHPVWRPTTIAGALDAAAARHPDRPLILKKFALAKWAMSRLAEAR